MKNTIHKTLFIFLLAFLSSFTFMAQVPEGIVYQAEARDQNGKILQNKFLEVEVNILQGSANGVLVWQGIHEIRTDKYGLITLTIGEGASSYNFSLIDWAHYAHFLNVRINNKGNWTDLGTMQFISVPYAIHSQTSEHAFNADEIDPYFNTWDKSTGITLTENQISDLDHFTNADEIDPIFAASTAKGIVSTDIENWDEAFSWSDHSIAGYLKSFTETDPIFATSEAANITANDIINLSNLSGVNTGDQNITAMTHSNRTALDAVSGTNTGDQDGSETKVTAGTNVTITGTGTTANPYVVGSTSGGASSLAIGDSYGGGIIFYLDASGQHGLIAATTDQSTAIIWMNGGIIGIFASSVGAGDGNTSRLSLFGEGAYAAWLCYALNTGGYDDWYLPSKYELNLMYMNIGQGNLLGLGNVGSFANSDYWSSTEFNSSYAWKQSFDNGLQSFEFKNYTIYVRAIRAF